MTKTATWTHSGKGEQLWFLGTLATIRLSGEASDGRFALIEFLFPRHASPPLHTHPQDESYIVLEGKLTIQAGRRRFELMPGGTAVVPMGVAHTFRVDSDEARVLVLSTPAGLERMSLKTGRCRRRSPRCRLARRRDRRPRNSRISSTPTDKSTSARRSRPTTDPAGPRISGASALAHATASRCRLGFLRRGSWLSSVGRADEACLVRSHDCLCAVAESEFYPEDVTTCVFTVSLLSTEAVGDLLVRETLPAEAESLDLAGCEGVEISRVDALRGAEASELGDQAPRWFVAEAHRRRRRLAPHRTVFGAAHL